MRYHCKVVFSIFIIIIWISPGLTQFTNFNFPYDEKAENIGYYPHWELIREGTPTKTSLFLSYVEPYEEIAISPIRIFVCFLRENGSPLVGQPIQLYEATDTYTTTITDGNGCVYFALTPKQSAKLVLTASDSLNTNLSFGFAKIGWLMVSAPDQPSQVKFLAWGATKTTSGFWFFSRSSEASISVNGGSSFILSTSSLEDLE